MNVWISKFAVRLNKKLLLSFKNVVFTSFIDDSIRWLNKTFVYKDITLLSVTCYAMNGR